MTSHSNDIEEALAAIEANDYSTAFEMLTVLADRGNPKAQLNLATLYHLGWGTSPDGKRAAELYEAVGMMGIAEEHISALAYHNLSTLYFVGAPGLGRDTEKGEEYHRLAKDLGFEMLESGPLMKRQVRFVFLIVLACGLASGCSARREREATLKQNLFMMRQAIDKYTLDKERAPQSLQDLVNEHYLKEIPTDPFTRKKDWVPEFTDTVLTVNQTMTGIGNVHSNSTQVGSNGIAYNNW